MEDQEIVFAQSTQVRRFRADQEAQHRNHLKFLKALADEHCYDQLRLYSLEADKSTEFPFMIVLTGSSSAFKEEMDPQSVQADKEADIIGKEFGGKWEAITPGNSVANIAGPGRQITSLDEFDKTMADIQSGRYSVTVIT